VELLAGNYSDLPDPTDHRNPATISIRRRIVVSGGDRSLTFTSRGSG